MQFREIPKPAARKVLMLNATFLTRSKIMKSNTLFGIAAIIAALGYTFRPFTSAHANIGPSVSTGSNPIFTEFGSYTTTSSWTTIDAVTSPSSHDAVIVRVRVDCNTNTQW